MVSDTFGEGRGTNRSR